MSNSRDNRNKNSAAQTPAIRADLVIETDYKTVKKEVWSKFIKIYGGGPSIVREKPSIYSAAVDDNPIPLARLRSPSPIESQFKGKRMAQLKPEDKAKLANDADQMLFGSDVVNSAAAYEPPQKNIFAKKLNKQKVAGNESQQNSRLNSRQ